MKKYISHARRLQIQQEEDYIRNLMTAEVEELKIMLADPPETDDFGNHYNGSRDHVFLCFANNCFTEKLSFEWHECLGIMHQVASELGI
jgi:hypothetical protein